MTALICLERFWIGILLLLAVAGCHHMPLPYTTVYPEWSTAPTRIEAPAGKWMDDLEFSPNGDFISILWRNSTTGAEWLVYDQAGKRISDAVTAGKFREPFRSMFPIAAHRTSNEVPRYELRRHEPPEHEFSDFLQGAIAWAFTPDYRMCVKVREGVSVEWWNVAESRLLWKQSIRSVACSFVDVIEHDGKLEIVLVLFGGEVHLLSASDGATIRQFKVETRTVLEGQMDRHPTPTYFSLNARHRLLCFGAMDSRGIAAVSLDDAERRAFSVHEYEQRWGAENLAWAPGVWSLDHLRYVGDKYLVICTGSSGRAILRPIPNVNATDIYDVETGKRVWFTISDRMDDIRVSPDGRWIARSKFGREHERSSVEVGRFETLPLPSHADPSDPKQ